MKETMFFATFETEKTKHDRSENFKQDKTLKSFSDWIEARRVEIEEKTKAKVLISSINIIKNEFKGR